METRTCLHAPFLPAVTGQALTFVPALNRVLHLLYLIKSLEACREVNFILPTLQMRKLKIWRIQYNTQNYTGLL